MKMIKRPKVGLASIIRKDGRVLLGLRKGTYAGGLWGTPGGHLEFGESFEQCAQRETREEAGIEIKNISCLTVVNGMYPWGKSVEHFVTIFMVSDYASGEVSVCEPDKCEKWDWFAWSDLPQPLMQSIESFLKNNVNPFDHQIGDCEVLNAGGQSLV